MFMHFTEWRKKSPKKVQKKQKFAQENSQISQRIVRRTQMHYYEVKAK